MMDVIKFGRASALSDILKRSHTLRQFIPNVFSVLDGFHQRPTDGVAIRNGISRAFFSAASSLSTVRKFMVLLRTVGMPQRELTPGNQRRAPSRSTRHSPP